MVPCLALCKYPALFKQFSTFGPSFPSSGNALVSKNLSFSGSLYFFFKENYFSPKVIFFGEYVLGFFKYIFGYFTLSLPFHHCFIWCSTVFL